MNIDHHDICVKYLRLLIQLLYKLGSQEDGGEKFLNGRLSPDMFPLKVQVKVAASFALRACCQESCDAPADPGEKIGRLEELASYLQDVIEWIERSDPLDSSEIEDKAGFK